MGFNSGFKGLITLGLRSGYEGRSSNNEIMIERKKNE